MQTAITSRNARALGFLAAALALPLATPGCGSAAEDTGSAESAATQDSAPRRTWMSGFLMSAVVDANYDVRSVDDAESWYHNIGTWRTGTSRNNCKVFNANSYPDPGQDQTILDYNFGTHGANGFRPPARWKPSSVGLQPVWSTSLTRGDGYGLRDTLAGHADGSFRTWFSRLVAYGQENAIIRLGWELNGNWFPWGIGAPVNTDKNTGYGSVAGAAAAYKSAFRRVVDIARSIPGEKFKFEFNSGYLDSDFGGVHVAASDVAAAYPGGPDGQGRDYVDYVGMDLYDSSYAAGTPDLAVGNGTMWHASHVVYDWKGPNGRRFASGDVGKSIQVYEAGPNGGATTSFPLYAKIVSVDTSANPPSATLNVAAVRNASGVMVNLFDKWPSATYDDPRSGFKVNLGAFSAFGRAKGKPLGISEWATQLRMDGHGGNDDIYFIELMYNFFNTASNNVAYETLFQGIDGKSVGPYSGSIVYPMIKQAAGGKNGPFFDGTDALPQSVAKYHELFGQL